MERIADADAKRKRRDAAQLTCELGGEADKVVFADRCDLHGVGVLEVGGIRVRVC